MRRWMLPAAVILLLAGCRTRQAETRTDYRYVTQHDSVRVERWDTVRIETRGDTVRVFEKLVEREYFSTIYRDTLRQSDTLRIERTTVEKSQCKKNGWKWLLAGLAIGITITIAIRVLIKIYLKR